MTSTPPTKNYSQTVINQIKRDLNSPSATLRIRALRALKSPTGGNYYNFDVPHEEQELVTEAERNIKPKTIQEVMKDVIVYVEVRTATDNRSAGIKKVISKLGAKVNDKLLRNTTHVVFKDGLQSTYKKAKNWNIPIVSVLWIEACKRHLVVVDPKSYRISNYHQYENPELYEKMKRHKSMQPGAEEKILNRKTPKCNTPELLDNVLTDDVDCKRPTPVRSMLKRRTLYTPQRINETEAINDTKVTRTSRRKTLNFNYKQKLASAIDTADLLDTVSCDAVMLPNMKGDLDVQLDFSRDLPKLDSPSMFNFNFKSDTKSAIDTDDLLETVSCDAVMSPSTKIKSKPFEFPNDSPKLNSPSMPNVSKTPIANMSQIHMNLIRKSTSKSLLNKNWL